MGGTIGIPGGSGVPGRDSGGSRIHIWHKRDAVEITIDDIENSCTLFITSEDKIVKDTITVNPNESVLYTPPRDGVYEVKCTEINGSTNFFYWLYGYKRLVSLVQFALCDCCDDCNNAVPCDFDEIEYIEDYILSHINFRAVFCNSIPELLKDYMYGAPMCDDTPGCNDFELYRKRKQLIKFIAIKDATERVNMYSEWVRSLVSNLECCYKQYDINAGKITDNMANLNITINANQPPTVDDIDITVDNGGTHYFLRSEFENAASDPEGDSIIRVKFDALPQRGHLYHYDGTNWNQVTSVPFEIDITELTNDPNTTRLKYVDDSGNSAAGTDHNAVFGEMDDGSNTYGY